VPTAVRQFVRSLAVDAYVVGGAVRDELLGVAHADEDFLVPGVDHAGLRALLEPHGRVEDMAVHGQLVGVRLYPRDRSVRALVPAGIELTPPRAERSTGPGHRDFEIVSDATIRLDDDMARRDFTVNAMARRLEDGSLLDPFGGLGDLARRELRTVTRHSFAEDPLRILRGLRLVSQLGFGIAGETLAQMRVEAGGLAHVSAERIGGGLVADGLGELSKLLLGRHAPAALRLARDTGVLEAIIPELGPTIGHDLGSPRHPGPLDEHLFAVVQRARELGAPLPVLLAALLHDAEKPRTAHPTAHAELAAAMAARVVARLRYPVRLQRQVVAIVRHHAFRVEELADARAARRFLARHGDELAFALLLHKEADVTAKTVPSDELEALVTARALLERERSSPHRIADLAIDGADLLALGFREGPALGDALHALLARVVDDPAVNEREALLAAARGILR
jgi:tRNA nucleotidyltransferase (CCA-adding enzyme)